MSADEKELLKEAQIKIHDLTLDDATRYRYQAIEKHILERDAVLRDREIALEEREKEWREKEIVLAKLEQSEQEIEQQSRIIKQLQQEIERLNVYANKK